jgi:arginase
MPYDNLSFLEKSIITTPVALLGIPLDIGKDSVGTDVAPDYLRKAGLLDMFKILNIAFTDMGNIECPTRATSPMGDKRAKYLSAIVETCKTIATVVDKNIVEGKKIVAIGGDHSLSIGTISGASVACSGDIGVIWIDAHGDMMTHENTLSGNVHGMPSSAVIGFGHPELVNGYKTGKKVDPQNIVYVGLKDLDQGEIDLIRKEKLRAITMLDVMHDGLPKVFKEIDELQKRVKHIWVSLDLDCIDVEYAPGTPIKNYGGFTYREITNLCRYIGKVCNVVGMDIVELSPTLDINNKTTELSIELIAALLGGEYNWYTKYMAEEEEKQNKR